MNEQELHQLQAWRILKGSIVDMPEYLVFMKKWGEYVDSLPVSFPQHEECAISHIGLYTLHELAEVVELNPADFGTDSFVDEVGDLFWCWYRLFQYYNLQQQKRDWNTTPVLSYFPFHMAKWVEDLQYPARDLELVQSRILNVIPRLLHKGWDGKIRGVDVTDCYSRMLEDLFNYIARVVVMWMFAETDTFNYEYDWSYDLNLESDQVKMFFALLTEIINNNLYKLLNRVEEGSLKTYDR